LARRGWKLKNGKHMTDTGFRCSMQVADWRIKVSSSY
jgi:hypothetical protein